MQKKLKVSCNNKYVKVSQAITENYCVAGKFSAVHKLPTRFYLELYDFTDVILETSNNDKKFFHPLGNKQHHKSGIKSAQIACYEAHIDEMRDL